MNTQILNKLIERQSLTSQEMSAAMLSLQDEDNTAQAAAFMTLLTAKGPTVTEMQALLTAMQASMVNVPVSKPVLDIVGTGGDGAGTVNISTGSALLAASCGVAVVKHGNRSVSSQCGSADLIEYLGYELQQTPEQIAASVEIHGFGFCYAPLFHPMLTRLKTVRRELGVPTCFNLLGPLLNPAHADYLMIGVAQGNLLSVFADIIATNPKKRAIIFNCQGLDEMCTVAPIDCVEVKGGEVSAYQIDPKDYGFEYCQLTELQGGDVSRNAQLLLRSLAGYPGAITDTLVLNAGVACYLYGVTDSIEEGISLAKAKQISGAAFDLLNEVAALSQTVREGESHAIIE